jgi:hypothetical protein
MPLRSIPVTWVTKFLNKITRTEPMRVRHSTAIQRLDGVFRMDVAGVQSADNLDVSEGRRRNAKNEKTSSGNVTTEAFCWPKVPERSTDLAIVAPRDGGTGRHGV